MVSNSALMDRTSATVKLTCRKKSCFPWFFSFWSFSFLSSWFTGGIVAVPEGRLSWNHPRTVSALWIQTVIIKITVIIDFWILTIILKVFTFNSNRYARFGKDVVVERPLSVYVRTKTRDRRLEQLEHQWIEHYCWISERNLKSPAQSRYDRHFNQNEQPHRTV